MDKIFKKPKLIIGIIVLLTIFFAFQLPKVNINNELDIFLPEEHPTKITDDKIEEIFGGNDTIVLAIRNNSDSIISRASITMVQQLTEKLENIINVEEVDSFTNTDYIEGTAGGMEVSDLVPKDTNNELNLEEIKRKLFSWPEMYRGNFYSEDLKSTQVSVDLKKNLTMEQKKEVYFTVEDILQKVQDNKFEFYLAGDPAVNILLEKNIKSDLALLIPFVILMIVISLYFSFKKWGGVILPLSVVLISTVWTVGLMSLLNIQFTILATLIPVLLIGVGSAYGIHIISHYYDELKETDGNITDEIHRKLIFKTLGKVGRPVFFAGVTTMVGFGSLIASDIVPMKEFGLFTAGGVAIAVLIAFLLIPAVLLVRHQSLDYSAENKTDHDSMLNKVLMAIYHYFSKNQIKLIIFTLLIAIICSYGATKIEVGTNLINMFKKDTEIRQSDKFINENFGGTNVLNVMIDGQENGSLTDPKILKEMENLSVYLQDNYSDVGNVISFADLLKRMNKVMHYSDEKMESSDTSAEGNNIKETTADFGEENTSSFGEEATSSFSEENTSSFGGNQDTTKDSNKSTVGDKIMGPSSENLSEKELIVLLNRAILTAKELDLSGNELVKEVSRELNYQGEAYNEIPYNTEKYNVKNQKELKRLVSQYLLLYSGNLDDLINDQLEPSKAKMTVQLRNGNSEFVNKIKNEISNYAAKNFPEGYSIEIAGNAAKSYSINNLITKAQLNSIVLALIMVFIIIAVDYKSIVAGFYGIVVLAFSLIVNFGIMGYAGIEMNVATAMISSIAIGIGIDYVIHFLSAYNAERKKTDDLEEINKNVLLSTGRAIIFNAISVALGFLVLIFSKFIPLNQFGILVAIIMVTSAGASITILPVLLNLFKPKFISK